MKPKKGLYITGIVLLTIGILIFSIPFLIIISFVLTNFENFDKLFIAFGSCDFIGMAFIIIGSMLMYKNKAKVSNKDGGIENNGSETYYENRFKKVDEDKVACPMCGYLNKKSDLYCDKCGSKLTKFCSKCGNVVSSDDKFCSKCGNKIE